MKMETTSEDRKHIMMEYFAQICFNKGTIVLDQLLPMALYLYRNADIGPKHAKVVAKCLVKLNDIMESISIDVLQDVFDREEARRLLKKLDRCSNQKTVRQYVDQKARETLQCACATMGSGNYIYEAYRHMTIQCYYQLEIDCKQHEYGNIYFRTKNLERLLQKNEEKKREMKKYAMNAKARLEVLTKMSKNPKRIIELSEIISALDSALEEQQYQNMQEETNIANATFAQTTRSSSYQKQIFKNIAYFYEND